MDVLTTCPITIFTDLPHLLSSENLNTSRRQYSKLFELYK
jgi:hypothetical protein